MVNIGNRLELFVDDHLIETVKGARLVLHRPREQNIALRYDKPWALTGGYVTVFKDGDLYRMYYSGRTGGSKSDDASGQHTCYAESRDGITWTEPELGLFEFGGTKKNNIVHAGDGPTCHNFSPFLDTRPGVAPGEKYKAIGGHKTTGLRVLHSPDGIRWRFADQPPIQPASPDLTRYDSQNLAFWSEHEQCYCCYFRIFVYPDGRHAGSGDGIRTIARTTSEDFVHWTEPVAMSFGDTPMEQLYINQTHPYYRAPHIYIAFPARFMKGRKILSDEEGAAFGVNHHNGVGYWQDCAETVFMTSRGGNAYDRTFMEGFVRPGLDRRNWVSRCNYAALGVVPTGPDEMSLYVNRHNQQKTAHISRFSLRTDGFSSLNAPHAGGEAVTKTLEFTGNRLVLNYATGAGGHVRVEIQDESGSPIKGYALSDADDIIGDEIERTVAWNGKPDVSALTKRSVRLRFVLKDADLYSFRFM
ncbi:MAG: hypothetical protein EA426_16955 [Spirochaetaceae bacterium]|nr:MAG: hypothetical protein EA426_16955 [Spirochaetaceae bacterium]